ncbi:MAG TPA: TMEM14 family protein [Abditibacteriaceae bacterium]|jgi:uncharacterized membrane protein (UPF0136 family)
MQKASLVSLVYGAFIAAGGIAGYITKGSLASIISGGACGAILIGCGLAMRKGMSAAWWVALVVTLMILGRFGSAFARTGDVWPSAITAAVSLVALIGLIVGRK